jgi:serine/threonine-protein kinase HipA
LSMCAQFGLKRDAAVAEAREVARVVRRWTTHFANEGVSARDLEHHEAQIDRPFLREQRRALARGDGGA